MTQDSDHHPYITRAAYEMAGYNNSPFSQETISDNLDTLLGSEGYDAADLALIEAWIGTLNEEQLFTLVDGEETEMSLLVAQSPDPAKTEGLMTAIFEEVI